MTYNEINAKKGMMPKLFLVGIIVIIAFESLLSINFTIYINCDSYHQKIDMQA